MGFTSRRVSPAATRTVLTDLIAARHALVVGDDGEYATNATAPSVPAFYAAAEIAAEAVAQLKMRVWRDATPARVPVTDVWQYRLLKLSPGPQDHFTFWHTLELSLEYRNNTYVWKTKAGGKVVALTALHPDQVGAYRAADGSKRFRVSFQDEYPLPPEVSGRGGLDVGEETILHIRGRGGIGEIVAPTPVQMFARTLGIGIAQQKRQSALLANGVTGGLAIEFPPGVKPEEADAWRERFDGRHAGSDRAGTTKVVGNGAKITPIGMTQGDAQFVETMNLTVNEIALITNVPAWLLLPSFTHRGANSPEHEMQRWLYHGLGPRLARIESALNADGDLFGPGDIFAAFDVSDVVRGDLRSEDAIAHQQIQDGRLLVDEWRVERGRAELPNGIGKIPQITPVGGAPNPVTPVVQSDDD
jgi:HK97 family phage portal protein